MDMLSQKMHRITFAKSLNYSGLATFQLAQFKIDFRGENRNIMHYVLLYIIDSIILILLKAITYNLYIYNQRGVTQLINIYFFLCFYNLLSRTL